MNKEQYIDLMSKHQISNMVINATNFCNCACPYCFTTPNVTHMSIDTCKKAINWLLFGQDYGEKKLIDHTVFINWFGGEPMLRFEELLKPIMLWAEEKQYPIQWGISSNCTLITPERLEFLKHFKTSILCSIDGTSEIQNIQRPLKNGQKSWDAIEPILPLLGDYPYGTVFRSTITSANANSIFDGYLLARKYGFPSYFAGLDLTDNGWTEDKVAQLFIQLLQISKVLCDDIESGYRPVHFTPFFNAIHNLFDQSKDKNTIVRCGLGTGAIGISPDGKFFGCQEHSTYTAEGDIFYIGDIDHGIDVDKHLNLLNTYEEQLLEFKQNKQCQNCEIADTCYMASCPSNCYRMYEKFCQVQPIFCTWRKLNYLTALNILTRAKETKNSKIIDYLMEVCV